MVVENPSEGARSEEEQRAMENEEKYHELAQIFDPKNEGGDEEMMNELDGAYEKSQQGEGDELEEMHEEWTKPKSKKEKAHPSEIKNILLEESSDLFEKIRKGPKVNEFDDTPQRLLMRRYFELCQQHGVGPDHDYFSSFLEDEGWEGVSEGVFSEETGRIRKAKKT